MREQIEERLAALRKEHETGVRMLADLDARRAELQQTLLRIVGAAQVLEELLGDGAGAPATPGNGHVPVGAAAGADAR